MNITSVEDLCDMLMNMETGLISIYSFEHQQWFHLAFKDEDKLVFRYKCEKLMYERNGPTHASTR